MGCDSVAPVVADNIACNDGANFNHNTNTTVPGYYTILNDIAATAVSRMSKIDTDSAVGWFACYVSVPPSQPAVEIPPTVTLRVSHIVGNDFLHAEGLVYTAVPSHRDPENHHEPLGPVYPRTIRYLLT